MSGLEGAILAGASKGLASALLSEEVIDSSLLDKLTIQINSIEALLIDAEEKLIEENARVEKWAQKARFAIYDAEDSLDGILADVLGSNKVRTDVIDIVERSKSFKDNMKYKSKNTDARAIHPCKKTIEKELVTIIERLKRIAAQKDNLGLKGKSELASYRKRRLTSSFTCETFTIYGRSEDKERIMRLLNSRGGNDDALRVIPIVGMAGIGKTTLACLVFHEYKGLNRSFRMPSWLERLVQREENHSNRLVFDMKGWACVSGEFDAARVIKSLLESITRLGSDDHNSLELVQRFITSPLESITRLGSEEDNSLELLQRELKEKLQDKKFLVVLDDVWTDDSQNWDLLWTSFSVGAPGSRVIVTTRSTQVARMVTTSPDFCYELDKLSRDESWFLFEEIVFRDGNSSKHPVLTDIGLDIVSRCKGLPLEIKMIGGLLLSKENDEIQWRSVLNNKIWGKFKIIPSLSLSYYGLPLGVRNCFAYCSIFPKDYKFSMEEVIMLWIGEGLIDKFCEGNRYEDVARAYFTYLQSIFFFQESSSGGSEFVMHNLIHDLAMHVSRGLNVDFRNMAVQSRRLSYIQGQDEALLNKISTKKLNHLRTFKPLREDWFYGGRWNFYLEKKLLGELISNLKLLRVLSLKGYFISILPESVGEMKLLRYLDLSHTKIDHLPYTICGLYNLQILLLSDCRKLKRLPKDICNLVNLRHLNIDRTFIQEMPDGIGQMRNIRTLSKFVVGSGKSKQIREFKELLHLHGVVHISGLNNVDDANDVAIAGFENKEYIKELVLDWDPTRAGVTEFDGKVLDAIEAHKNLKSLTIYGYRGKRLSDWIVGVSPSFTNMVTLSLSDCFNLEGLPSLGNLPFLKCLKMERLNRIESFGEEFYGDGQYPFQALQKLIIDRLPVLKTWCFVEGDRVGFQILSDLQIQNCYKLAKIPYCFPSLARLSINFCPNLVKLQICREAKDGSSSRKTYPHFFQSIRISWCPKLKEIPNSFANSGSFEVENCDKLVPVLRLQHVRSLTLINWGFNPPVKAALQDCRVRELEELTIRSALSNFYGAELHRFTSLKRLKLMIPVGSEDEAGEVMIRLPPNLSDLTIDCVIPHACTKILNELSNLNSLTKLHFYNYSLESFPDVKLPSTLKSLTVHQCSALRTIPDGFLSACSQSLQELHIENCPSLVCLPSTLSTIQSLQTLQIEGCGSIHQLPTAASSGPNYLTNLSYLRIHKCPALERLPDGFHKATTLHTLHIDDCPNICVTKDGFPVNLRRLHITNCGKMKPIVKTVLPSLTYLTHLYLEEFPDISSLDHCLPESIQTLFIRRFPHLKSLSGVLSNLKHLRKLCVEDCPLADQNSWS